MDEGVRLAIPTRVVGYCERDAFAASILLARMEDQALDPAPVWCGDLQDLDCGPFRGHVDMVTAGYPCQPFSVAGKQQGEDDPRHLWPQVLRAIRETGARYAFLENVPGHLRLGFDRVLGDLAEAGFDAEWALVRASDVGATHRRERLFVLAHARRESDDSEQPIGVSRSCGAASIGGVGEDVGYAGGSRLAQRGGRTVAPTLSPAWPPGPGDVEGWRAWDGPQPAVRRDADGIPHRVDRLRCLGNAVVPQQAALAFRELWERMT